MLFDVFYERKRVTLWGISTKEPSFYIIKRNKNSLLIHFLESYKAENKHTENKLKKGKAMNLNIEKGNEKRVIIVGGGFGGLELAKRLRRSGMQIVLIDKHNYHQFQPLIYQVASAGMEPSSISFPYRRIFQKYKNLFFRLASVTEINTETKTVVTNIGSISYDYLVLSAGATTNFFGNKEIERAAMPMKSLSEATGIRNTILANIERAITTNDPVLRQELLNIVIVGGGATGVELAGVLSEMKKTILPRDYPELDTSLMNVYLIQGDNRLLPAMAQESSTKAINFLRSMGVNVILSKFVNDYKDHKVVLNDGSSIATRSLIWVSGIIGVAFNGLPKEMYGRGRRIVVNGINQVIGLEDVFCIGDQCIMPEVDKAYMNGHPQLAQVAIQQGKRLASNLIRIEKGKKTKQFSYTNLGSMATVGRNKAVAEFSLFNTQGFIAWVLWLVVHLRSILGIRNRIVVLLNWLWNYVNYNQSLRLIFRSGRDRNEGEI